jgi:hypothetical protein
MDEITTTQKKNNGMATASLVLGIVGLVCCCGTLVLSVLAIIFGVLAKSEMKRSGNHEGEGMATAGFVLGIVGLVVHLISIMIWLLLFVSKTHAGRHLV